MNKKLLLSIVSVLLVITIAGWIYFFLTKNKNLEQPTTLPSPSPVVSFNIPPQKTQEPRFEQLSADWAVKPAIASTSVIFFNRTKGVLKNISLVLNTKQETNLSDTIFDNINTIVWSPNKKMVAFLFTQYDQERISVFDLLQSIQYTLPRYFKNPVWSVDSKRLAVYHDDPLKNEHFISIIQPDGSKEQKLVSMVLPNPTILWQTQDTIVFYQKPAPQTAIANIFQYNLKTKSLSSLPLAISGAPDQTFFGFDMLPSPKNDFWFFSFTDKNGGGLMTYINQGNTIIEPPMKTLVQKCVWSDSGENIYCAYSNALANAPNLPFDYWTGRISSSDSFARFNVKTGEFKIYAENTGYDAIDLAISPDESFLVFVNRKDLSLYKMKL